VAKKRVEGVKSMLWTPVEMVMSWFSSKAQNATEFGACDPQFQVGAHSIGTNY